jgi:hypothetical protein
MLVDTISSLSIKSNILCTYYVRSARDIYLLLITYHLERGICPCVATEENVAHFTVVRPRNSLTSPLSSLHSRQPDLAPRHLHLLSLIVICPTLSSPTILHSHHGRALPHLFDLVVIPSCTHCRCFRPATYQGEYPR